MICFWGHTWKATGVEHYASMPRWADETKEDGRPYTFIRRMCTTCGDVSTKEETGHYTLEELTKNITT